MPTTADKFREPASAAAAATSWSATRLERGLPRPPTA